MVAMAVFSRYDMGVHDALDGEVAVARVRDCCVEVLFGWWAVAGECLAGVYGGVVGLATDVCHT